MIRGNYRVQCQISQKGVSTRFEKMGFKKLFSCNWKLKEDVVIKKKLEKLSVASSSNNDEMSAAAEEKRWYTQFETMALLKMKL